MCIFNFMYNTHTFVIEIFSCLPLFKKNIATKLHSWFFHGFSRLSRTKKNTCQLHSKIRKPISEKVHYSKIKPEKNVYGTYI